MPAFALHSALSLPDIRTDVWHADALSFAPGQVVSTGDALLNAQLPGGGWPVGALTEILQADGLHSEWRLLLPALAHSGTGPVVLVGAPHTPFAPALASQGLLCQRLLWVSAHATAQRLWACEQALRCAEVDAVLLWLSGSRKDAVRKRDMFRRVLQIDEADAIALANGTDYGLLAAVWTESAGRLQRVAKAVKAGQVFMNCYGAGGGVELPFGGTKRSGHGREKGLLALEEVSTTKTLVHWHG